MKTILLGGLVGILASVSVAAQAQQLSPEDQIKFRKAGYAFMSWNMGKIKAQAIDGSVEYNPQQVASAANAIAGIANSGMGALFGPGTEQDVGSQTTRVEPALFDNLQDIVQLSEQFVAAANNLAEVAEGGSQNDVRDAFGKLGQACKACHDKYRKQ